MTNDWQLYRTRFLVRAKQLTQPMAFVDVLGREHCGNAGDYLVQSSDGSQRIAPREIFEDVYVPMGPADDNWIAMLRGKPSESRYPSPSPSRFLMPCDHRAS